MAFRWCPCTCISSNVIFIRFLEHWPITVPCICHFSLPERLLIPSASKGALCCSLPWNSSALHYLTASFNVPQVDLNVCILRPAGCLCLSAFLLLRWPHLSTLFLRIRVLLLCCFVVHSHCVCSHVALHHHFDIVISTMAVVALHCDIMIQFRCSFYVAVMSWHSRSSIVDLVASQYAYVHIFVCRCRVGGSALCPLLSVPCSGFSCNALWRLCSEFFELCFTPCALCLLQMFTSSIPFSHVTMFILGSFNVRFDNPGSC